MIDETATKMLQEKKDLEGVPVTEPTPPVPVQEPVEEEVKPWQ